MPRAALCKRLGKEDPDEKVLGLESSPVSMNGSTAKTLSARTQQQAEFVGRRGLPRPRRAVSEGTKVRGGAELGRQDRDVRICVRNWLLPKVVCCAVCCFGQGQVWGSCRLWVPDSKNLEV